MRPAHIGRLLLALGLLVGVAASVGLLIGFEPARLPPALLNLAAYKLAFIAAFGLLAGGAAVQRLARRGESGTPSTPGRVRHELDAQQLSEPQPGSPAVVAGSRQGDASRVIEQERRRSSP